MHIPTNRSNSPLPNNNTKDNNIRNIRMSKENIKSNFNSNAVNETNLLNQTKNESLIGNNNNKLHYYSKSDDRVNLNTSGMSYFDNRYDTLNSVTNNTLNNILNDTLN